MRHFVFGDYDESGEEFIVGADTLDDAIELACVYFTNPTYLCEYSEEEAEASGLDEY